MNVMKWGGLALAVCVAGSAWGRDVVAQTATASPPSKAAATSSEPKIQGKYAILVDTRTGQVLWEKDSTLRRPIASLTKVMTALLILESGRLDETVIASSSANATQYSSMYLAVGEKVKLRDLLWAIMLRSANDACVAAAEHLDGSVLNFVDRMNRRAQELGLKNTHFVTVNGLHDPDHYSTARDMARITLEAMKYPLFNEVVKSQRHSVIRSIRKQNALMINRARILRNWELADGVKTGYTKQAGHCFIGSATYGGWRLLSVVLNSPQVGGDTRTLLGYGFRRYQSVKLADAGQPMASIPVSMGLEKRMPLGFTHDLYAVYRKGSTPPTVPPFTGLPGSLAAPVTVGTSVLAMPPAGPSAIPFVDNRLVALKTVEASPIAAAASRTPWGAALLVVLTFGVLKVGSSAKNHRASRRRPAPRRRKLDRSR